MKIRKNRHQALRTLRKWEDSLFWHYHDPLYCAQSSGSRIKLSKKEWRNLQRLRECDPQPTRDARIFKKQSALFHFMRAYSLETLESTERLLHRWLRENHKLKDLYVLYEIIDRNTDVFPALEDLKFSYGIRLPFKRKDLLKWLPKDLGKCEANGAQRVFFYISDMAKRRREEERKRLESNL